MCQYFEWELNVDPITLREFEGMICKDFVDPGPYPTYILPSTKKTTAPPTANPFAAPSSTSPSLSYGQWCPSPPKLIFPAPQNPTAAYMTPPTTPDTPSPSYSASTSPTSSASRTILPISYQRHRRPVSQRQRPFRLFTPKRRCSLSPLQPCGNPNLL